MMSTIGPWPYFDKTAPVKPAGSPSPFLAGYSIELQSLILSMLSIDATKRPSIAMVVERLQTLCHAFKQCSTCDHVHYSSIVSPSSSSGDLRSMATPRVELTESTRIEPLRTEAPPKAKSENPTRRRRKNKN
jgi:serine/threonine protein kinase